MASCISWLLHCGFAPERLSGTTLSLPVFRTSKPARWYTVASVSVSLGRPAGRSGWAPVFTVVAAAVPCAQSYSNSTGWKYGDAYGYVSVRAGPPPDSVTVALTGFRKPRVTWTSTVVYGNVAIPPSLYQIAPLHRSGPTAWTFAIHCVFASRPEKLIPLTTICG